MICSVVVTYNPTSLLLKNVEALKRQTDFVLIVDNNSTDKEILDYLKADERIKIIFNVENLGVAAALNLGLRYASEHGYMYCLTMDQDSIILDNCVSALLNVLESRGEIASVGANFKKLRSRKQWKFVSALITSGNLVKTEIALHIGGYLEKLFIDGVDTEFSLRLKDNGYKSAYVFNANIIHSIGEMIEVKTIFGKRKVQYHTPIRYYYIFRNHRYLKKNYGKNNRLYLMKLGFAHWIDKTFNMPKHSDYKEKKRLIKQAKADFNKI